jgi:hypothetical protein
MTSNDISAIIGLAKPMKNVTYELGAAMVRLLNDARDGRGLHVYLANPSDPDAIRCRMVAIARWFEDGCMFFPDHIDQRESALTNIILLAEVLREHIRSANAAVKGT